MNSTGESGLLARISQVITDIEEMQSTSIPMHNRQEHAIHTLKEAFSAVVEIFSQRDFDLNKRQ